MKNLGLLRWGGVLVAVGMLFELVCVVSTTPATFVIFGSFGVPLILGGMGCYGLHVWRELVKKGAL